MQSNKLNNHFNYTICLSIVSISVSLNSLNKSNVFKLAKMQLAFALRVNYATRIHTEVRAKWPERITGKYLTTG